ncbi:hypothetical protein PIROE2DRAFT_14677 [Piromyces sp. E2]|nr:hypothetical protein PIROE2DRAFT_14677 [Piromyces sp. E2]|eukprot:OUM59707.1 hypothetical protein PIROE2DRAFT_14677 [Piromyces sp. E2]
MYSYLQYILIFTRYLGYVFISKLLVKFKNFYKLWNYYEEFLFRYLIFGLFKKYGQKIKKDNLFKGQLVMVFAFILSSLLFSFGHFSVEEKDLIFINITYYRFYFDIEYFVMGIIHTWIYNQYGYILTNVVAQMLYNIVEISNNKVFGHVLTHVKVKIGCTRK